MSFLINNFLVNPAVWLWLMGIYLLFLFYSRPWRQKAFLIPLGLLLLLTLPPLARMLVSQKERTYLPLEQKLEGKYILILGAGSTPDPDLTVVQQVGGTSLPRVVEAYSQFLRCEGCILVCSSTGRTGYRPQAEIHAEVLEQWGVPFDRIETIPEPNSTIEEARGFIDRFPEAKELVLVTSALHMPRAAMIFRDLGLEVIPAPCNYRYPKHPGGARYQYIPSLRSLESLSSYLHEVLGTWQWRYFRGSLSG